jgi:GNAT superfamily N-acetyltransferase
VSLAAVEELEPPEAAVIFRPANEDDRPFILNSWVRSYEETWLTNPTGMTTDELRVFSGLRGDSAARAAKAFYERHQRRRAMSLLECSTCNVACIEDHPEDIVGWCCQDEPEIHYVYVKAPFRGYGIGTALLPTFARPVYTHMTEAGRRMVR